MTAITITDAAHDYLADLLSKQNTPGIGIRVFINGVEVPAFIGWDTQYDGSLVSRPSDFRRVLWQSTLDPSRFLTRTPPGLMTP